MKVLLFSILASLFIVPNVQKKETVSYIMIQYTGDVSKPYPVIIFNCNAKFDSTYESVFVHKFQVNEAELCTLEQIVSQKEIPITSDILPDPMAIQIVINQKDTALYLRQKLFVSKLFYQLGKQFKGSDKQDLEYALNELSHRTLIPIIDNNFPLYKSPSPSFQDYLKNSQGTRRKKRG
jgi:hypothetical protein